MTWERVLSIALAAVAANLLRAVYTRYATWRDDPNRIKTASPDWRGRYVPDLQLKRAERGLLWAAIIFFATCLIWGYFIVTAANPPTY